jgi:hypothetical protein
MYSSSDSCFFLLERVGLISSDSLSDNDTLSVFFLFRVTFRARRVRFPGVSIIGVSMGVAVDLGVVLGSLRGVFFNGFLAELDRLRIGF